jgi:hypothetical protein
MHNYHASIKTIQVQRKNKVNWIPKMEKLGTLGALTPYKINNNNEDTKLSIIKLRRRNI